MSELGDTENLEVKCERLMDELERVEQSLPETYYAALPLPERVKIIVEHWRRLVPLCQQMEGELERVKADCLSRDQVQPLVTCLRAIADACQAAGVSFEAQCYANTERAIAGLRHAKTLGL